MSETDATFPPLGALLGDVEALRASSVSFEAMARDREVPVDHARAVECLRIAYALELAAAVIESGTAWAGGHLAALELKIRGK